MERKWQLFFLISFLTISWVSVAAQTPSNVRIGIEETKPMMLSLADAIKWALENNGEIEVERINVQQASSDLDVARGSYDPSIALSQSFVRQLTPITSSLGGSTNGVLNTKTFSGDFTLRGLLSSGGTYELGASTSRIDTSNLFVNLNPQTNTAINFQFRQPLMRNREIDDVRRRLRVAQRRLDISDSQFRQRVIEIITQVQRAYWDLVFMRRSVDIAQESVALAETQLARARRLIEAGTQAPVDLVQIEAQLQRRQEEVLVALENVTRAENGLKLLMLPNRNAVEWSYPLLPTDMPQVKFVSFELNTLVAGALANRPELQQLNLQKELLEDEKRYFYNQTKPQFDFIASYSLVGLAGKSVSRTNPFSSANALFFARVNEISKLLNLTPLATSSASTPDFLVGGIGQSLTNIFENRFNTIRVGIQLQLPLRNRVAAGQLARAEWEGRKANIQRQRMEALIESEVRNTLQAARTAQERIQAAHAARVAAENQLESEQRRYEAGLSTNFLVLTRQQELSEARGRELRALTDYDKALAELQRVTGTTLKTNNVEVQAPNN